MYVLPERDNGKRAGFHGKWEIEKWEEPSGGGTPLFGLYGDVPLDRVWFFGLAVLNRVYNLTCLCPKQVKTCPEQGMVLRAERL